MKGQKFKKLLVSLLTLLLIVTSVPLSGNVYAASQTFNLNATGTVKGTYDDSANTLVISGYGQIERSLWHDMQQTLTGGQGPYINWASYKFNANLKFEAAIEMVIALPADSSRLFFQYAGTIDFGEYQVDVSPVENMNYMFYNTAVFNQPLNNWDTSNVTDMSYMFAEARQFNQPLNDWDTSKVNDMNHMFSYALNFDQPLNKWDTSAVTDMSFMFADTEKFNQSLNNWDTSKVNDMNHMFYYAKKFNQPINNWDTSNVTDMSCMFETCPRFNQPLANWDTSEVTNMSKMFFEAQSFDQPLDNWDTSAVTDMSYMFYYATRFNQPLNNWDTSNVTDTRYMFAATRHFNQPLNNWDTSKVKNMAGMFNNARSFNQVVKLDISSATTTSTMFAETRVKSITLVDNTPETLCDNPLGSDYSKADLEYFEFNGLNAFTLNGFSGDYVVEKDGAVIAHKSKNETFNFEAGAYYKVYRQFKKPLSDCTVDPIATQTLVGDAVTPAVIIKDGDYQLVQGQDYNVSYQNNTAPGTGQAVVEGVGNYQGNLTISFIIVENNVQTINLNQAATVIATYNDLANTLVISGYGQIERDLWREMVNDLMGCNYVENINWYYNGESFDAAMTFKSDPNSKIAFPSDSSQLFTNYNGTIDFGQNQIDTSQVIDMSYMFSSARAFNSSINDWDTSNVTNMFRMFQYCDVFNQPLDNWDTSNVTNMESMFANTLAFDQPIDQWDTSNVTNMRLMFFFASAYNQPLDNWDISNVTSMESMFSHATSFNQPLNSWHTSKVTTMRGMFNYAESFNQPLDSWDTSSVINMQSMFQSAKAFNWPLEQWDTSKVTTMRLMFYHAEAFNQSVKFNISNLLNKVDMFMKTRVKSIILEDATPDTLLDNQKFYGYSKADLEYFEFNGLTAFTLSGFSGDYVVEKDGAVIAHKSKNETFNFEAGAHYKVYRQFKKSLSDCTVDPITTQVLTTSGSAITPPVVIRDGAYRLVKDQDYSVSYQDNRAPGTGQVLIEGIGDYQGSLSVTFEIVLSQKSLAYCTFLPILTQTTTGGAVTPEIYIIDNGYQLVKDKDFTVTYRNNNRPGPARAIIYGIGHYKGYVRLPFFISGTTRPATKSLINCTVEPITTQLLVSGSVKPQLIIKDGDYQLINQGDYIFRYFNNDSPGTGYIVIQGIGDYKDSRYVSFDIVAGKKLLSDCTVEPITMQTLIGDRVTPAVVIKNGDYQLVEGQDYNASYQNNMAAGVGQVLIEGKGNYDGNLTVEFLIVTPSNGNDGDDEEDDDGGGNLSNDTIVIAVPDNRPLDNAIEMPSQPQQLLPVPNFNDVTASAWYYRPINYLVARGIMRGTAINRFTPNQPANRAMVTTMLYRLSGERAPNSNMPFGDVVGGQWYSSPIKWAQQQGIVKGDQLGFFKPLKAISRQDLVVMLYRYAAYKQYDVTGRTQLSQRYWDSVKIAPYATNAMQWAVQNGIIEGVSKNRLAPRGRASRAQAAMIVTRFMQRYMQK